MDARLFVKRNASTILIGLGTIGVVATSITAVKATPKALHLIEEAEKEKGEKLTKWEKVKTASPSYISAIGLGVATVTCIIGAEIINQKSQASLISAYAFLDQSYKDYRRKLKELYGEETHQNIIDALAIEKAENKSLHAPGYVSNNDLYLDEQCGDKRLFYDEYGQRFFEATLEQVISAEYHLNRNYVLRGYTVLNELYDFIGLEPTDYGSEIGWVINDYGSFWIDFNHREIEIEGQVCVLIEMPFGPSMEWKDYY